MPLAVVKADVSIPTKMFEDACLSLHPIMSHTGVHWKVHAFVICDNWLLVSTLHMLQQCLGTELMQPDECFTRHSQVCLS